MTETQKTIEPLEDKKSQLLRRIDQIALERQRLVDEWNQMLALLEARKNEGDSEAVKDLTLREKRHWQRIEDLDIEKEEAESRIGKADRKQSKNSRKSIPDWVIAVTLLATLAIVGGLADSVKPEVKPAKSPPPRQVAAPAPKHDPKYTPGMVHQLTPMSYTQLLKAANPGGLTTAQLHALGQQYMGLMVQWSGTVNDVWVWGDEVTASLTVDGMPLKVKFEGDEAKRAVNLNVGQAVRVQGVVESFATITSLVPVLKYGKIL